MSGGRGGGGGPLATVTKIAAALGIATAGRNADAITADIVQLQKRPPVSPPPTFTLIGGQDNEAPTGTSATVTADTVNFSQGVQAWKVTTAGATTGQFRFTPPAQIKTGPASAIGMRVYVSDVTKITSISLELRHPDPLGVAGAVNWSRSAAQPSLVNGWNLLRWTAAAGMVQADLLARWGQGIDFIRVNVVTNAATDISIQSIWAECPAKAQILFIEDGGYETFRTGGYLDLKKRGIPVEWSLDPVKLGTGSGIAQRITEADVAVLARENRNVMGWHGYTGDVTSSMTAAQIRADNLNAISWLRQRGYFSGVLWRSAWVQNSATNHAAAQPFMMAYATPNSGAALTCFPPTDRWNIPRISVHGRDTATMTAYFDVLKVTRQLFVCYTHTIDAAGGTNATPAEWAVFLAQIDRGLSEGWLEGVTFPELLAQWGVTPQLGVDWITPLFDRKFV